MLISVGEQLSPESTFGSGVLNIFQPNRLIMMDDQDAALELDRVINANN